MPLFGRLFSEVFPVSVKPTLDGKPVAFVADDNGRVAYVFAGKFTAKRDAKGVWTSPSPPVTGGVIAEEFTRLPDKLAMDLFNAARTSSSV